MSFWKKSMEYLGLGPDDAYDDYDDGADPEPPASSATFVARRRKSPEPVERRPTSWPAEPDSGTGEGRAGPAELPVA